MRRTGKKIRWDAKAIVGLGSVLLVIFAVMQVPNFVSVWFWGPSSGHRSAGLDNGHYERRFPAILRGMPMIGLVLVGSDERLVIDYDLTIDEGTASFSIWKWPVFANRPQDIGPRQIRVSDRGHIEVAPNEAGFYRIYMYAHRLQGAVEVDWRTEEAKRHAAEGT